jgi:hypothetical protein
MEIRNINCYCIDSDEKKFDAAYYWTNAGEEEFKELLDNYLSENNIQEDKKFKVGMFTMYIWQHGFYIHTRSTHVFPPRQPK